MLKHKALAIGALLLGCLGWMAPSLMAAGRSNTVVEGRHRGAPGCVRGSVMAGGASGAIDFVVKCKGVPGRERLGFRISGYTEDEAVVSRIAGFRRHPGVGGSGGSDAKASCRRDRSRAGLECSVVGAGGQVSIKGRLWVPPEQRCSMVMSLTTSGRSGLCQSVCSASDSIRVIYNDVARGC